MARRYFVRPLPAAGSATLPPAVGHHLSRVLRVQTGTRLKLFDGAGQEASATVEAVQRDRVTVTVESVQPVHREPARQIEVAFPLPKGNRAEWLFEHGTEVGIAAFRPYVSARSNQRNPSGERPARWERILIAAAGQCDRSHLPRLHPACTLEGLVTDPDLPARRLVAVPDAPRPLAPGAAERTLLLVGPEGGLDPNELEGLQAADFAAVGLGPLTLRTETAVLVGAARLLDGE